MCLKELIAALMKADPEQIVPLGFCGPHSYRGDYSDVAFEPRRNISIAEMLAAAREALGSTYQGYKGGDFKMTKNTECWLAYYGECGESIGPVLLAYMLGQIEKEIDPMETARHTSERWQVAAAALYRLNTHGTNQVSALVNVGFDDNGQRMTNAECEQIAAELARAANHFEKLAEALRIADIALRTHPGGDNRSDDDIALARAALRDAGIT
jgi:hypothetical protein